MSISYKSRKRLKRLATVLIVLLAVALVCYGAWVLWAGRYILYTREGVALDMTMSDTLPIGTPAQLPETDETLNIIYCEPLSQEDGSSPSVVQTSINGYYISTTALEEDIASLRFQLDPLPAGTAIMLDMKNIRGEFYYHSSVGSKTDKDIDPEQINQLLEFLHSKDFYVIARIPAFRDREYGLNHVPHGLAKKGGNGSLWMDDQGCYWLDPTSDGALGYLAQQLMELKGMGFDEVVFTEFCFPNTDKIVFDDDRSLALKEAAAQLAGACATDHFFVSFAVSDPTFSIPDGNSRIYLEGIAAAEIPQILGQVTVSKPEIQLMFLTDVNDTRFNDYCVLRPLESAH